VNEVTNQKDTFSPGTLNNLIQVGSLEAGNNGHGQGYGGALRGGGGGTHSGQGLGEGSWSVYGWQQHGSAGSGRGR